MTDTRFRDRRAAGIALARRFKQGTVPVDALVLGLARGGVPVAEEIAQLLNLELDVLNLRKLGLPYHPELAMGAIAEDGTRLLDHELIANVGVTEAEIARVQAEELATLVSRIRSFRAVRPPAEVSGRTVILVDDGIATGTTMTLAIQLLRKRGASHIIVAVPVGPVGTVKRFTDLADQCICLMEPQGFSSVGLWYRDFHQVPESTVIEALKEAQARSRDRNTQGRANKPGRVPLTDDKSNHRPKG
ncbi:phosphoribosyltransferase [Marinobacter caseinilyticus]|uniref:phosphoribosyltransferase n=1 Tax=Marinobacter caseinilyticus TaxID=2692195 RepID=UPI0014082632|nr:phosphoribosyltransferase family protein [Marinobacter caseinilyticus]